MDETERKKDCGNNKQGELTKGREGTTAEAKDRNSGLTKENDGQREPKTSNLFFSFQYVTSQYSSLSDRWVVRKGKKLERRLDLEREEEIRNHVKNENGLREMEQYRKDIDWKVRGKKSCEK